VNVRIRTVLVSEESSPDGYTAGENWKYNMMGFLSFLGAYASPGRARLIRAIGEEVGSLEQYYATSPRRPAEVPDLGVYGNYGVPKSVVTHHLQEYIRTAAEGKDRRSISKLRSALTTIGLAESQRLVEKVLEFKAHSAPGVPAHPAPFTHFAPHRFVSETPLEVHINNQPVRIGNVVTTEHVMPLSSLTEGQRNVLRDVARDFVGTISYEEDEMSDRATVRMKHLHYEVHRALLPGGLGDIHPGLKFMVHVSSINSKNTKFEANVTKDRNLFNRIMDYYGRKTGTELADHVIEDEAMSSSYSKLSAGIATTRRLEVRLPVDIQNVWTHIASAQELVARDIFNSATENFFSRGHARRIREHQENRASGKGVMTYADYLPEITDENRHGLYAIHLLRGLMGKQEFRALRDSLKLRPDSEVRFNMRAGGRPLNVTMTGRHFELLIESEPLFKKGEEIEGGQTRKRGWMSGPDRAMDAIAKAVHHEMDWYIPTKKTTVSATGIETTDIVNASLHRSSPYVENLAGILLGSELTSDFSVEVRHPGQEDFQRHEFVHMSEQEGSHRFLMRGFKLNTYASTQLNVPSAVPNDFHFRYALGRFRFNFSEERSQVFRIDTGRRRLEPLRSRVENQVVSDLAEEGLGEIAPDQFLLAHDRIAHRSNTEGMALHDAVRSVVGEGIRADTSTIADHYAMSRGIPSAFPFHLQLSRYISSLREE